MTRFIEIQDEDDNKLLTTNELPFVIHFYDSRLKVSTLESFNNNAGSEVYAYLAQDDGHLFFQPEMLEKKIFHNDEWITHSVWIKSGDIISIDNKLILFKISGDRIEIKLIDKSKTTLLSPPPIEQLIVHKSNGMLEEDKSHLIRPDDENNFETTKNSLSGKKTDTKKFIYPLLGILIIFVLFLILAESVSIKTEPVVNDLEIKGLLPALKINNRYIALKGEYQVYAEKEGYKDLNKTITIDANNRDFLLTLKEQPGFIKFEINPVENNEIYINDTLLGTGVNPENKVVEYELDKGKYLLKVINPRYKVYEQKIKIEGKNKAQSFSPELIPNWGYVKIETIPEAASVSIISKNNVIKQSLVTPVEVELIAGEYDLVINKDKYQTQNINIQVKSEQTDILEPINLKPKDAKLTIISSPEKALIQINGKFYGKTPQTLELPSEKEYEIEISSQAYKTTKETIQLAANEKRELKYSLKPEAGTLFISTSPREAKLYIDGVLQSQSNGRFLLTGKNKTITVKAKGYIGQTKKVSISDYSKSVTFQLKKENTSRPKKIIKTNQTAKANVKTAYVNSVGLKMITVKGQVFTMGSPGNERGRRTNELEHQVNLKYDFYLSDKEVSNKMFKQFNPSHNSGMAFGQTLDTANQPVVNISWNDAAKFANWLSEKEGLTPYYKNSNGKMTPVDLNGKINGYRLPFEAEWELAARGLERKKYPWGESYPPKTVNGNYADESVSNYLANVVPGYNDKNRVTAMTGFYNASASGFYDLGGNVSEWCQDYFTPMMKSGLQINPTGPKKGTHKVVRGSSWKDSSITDLRFSFRGYSRNASNDIGFRLARYAK
jgi:formylglycine-generating enzyme required for sulfatase activity